ncbi:MAG: SGNH/GDSL hydrolase family protein [bacterium]
MGGTKPKSGLIINLLIFLVVIIICLVAAEVILRLAWRGYNPQASGNPLMAYDDTLGWIGKPNAEELLIESCLSVPCRTNQWGFRDDQPPPLEMVKDKRKIMFLGDSFIMGTGVTKEARVSELLEQRDSTLISYNFGIFGYSTDQELLALKKFGPMIQPDDVFLFFCANDLIYNDSDLGHRVPKPHYRVLDDGSLELGNVPVPPLPEKSAFKNWLTNHFALVQITNRILAQVAYKKESERQRPTAGDLGLEGVRGRRSDDLDSLVLFSSSSNISDLTFHLLKELKAESDRQNARLTIFTTPSNHHWTATREDTPAEIQRVLDWCAELGINLVDLFPRFHQDYLENNETLYLPDKMHWNERGNQVVAAVLMELLNESPNREIPADN